MTTHFFDIKLKPCINLSINHVASYIFIRLHVVLVSMKTDKIGISFPEYHKTLGNVIRLHAQENELVEFLEKAVFLKRKNLHIEVSKILPVPLKHTFVITKRVQPKSKINHKNTAYLLVRSFSSGEKFSFFIEQHVHQQVQSSFLKTHNVSFSSYGLSRKDSPVPFFQL